MIDRRTHYAGFTLIEMMLAVLLLALLAAAAVLNFSGALKSARRADALELVRSFDATCRQAANVSGRNVRLVFDLSSDTLFLRDGADLQNLRSHISLPPGCRIDAVQIAGHLVSAGQAMIDISPHGWSRSYALHLDGAGTDRWLVFAGLSGQMSQVTNETQIPTYQLSPRRDVD